MKNCVFFHVALFALALHGSAQKHDYNWVMGGCYSWGDPHGNMRLDFNYNPPKVFKEDLGMHLGSGGTCAFSDSSGNLLFYSNGFRIFNKNRQLMENGDSLNIGGHNWIEDDCSGYPTYPPIVLPLPEADNICYLFHTATELVPGSVKPKYFYYTIIDMKANGGLGRVVAKNQLLIDGRHIWPAYVKHGNGRDWWIMCARRDDTRHLLYLLSPEGLSGPYVQDIGPPFELEEYACESLFSPNGELYLRHEANLGLRLYDFDRCTGQLSNLRILPRKPTDLTSIDAEFSPDSRFLYLSRPGWVRVLDLQEPNLAASLDTVAYWELNYYPRWSSSTGYGCVQLGPDGKIYWAGWGLPQALNVLHRPTLPGDAADCEEAGFLLPRYQDFNLCQFPNYRLGEWESSPCDTLNAQRPGDGFEATIYRPERLRRDTDYVVLPPLPGEPCPDCTEEDLRWLNDLGAILYARWYLQETGQLPQGWPKEKAERSGLILSPPKRLENSTRE